MAESDMTRGAGESQAPSEIVFHYLKSNFFRVIHCDGAIGGVTPSGFIHMSVFSERSAIPTQVKHALHPDGTLGEERSQNSRGGIVREMEVDLMMTIEHAERLQIWLSQQIDKARRAHAPQAMANA